MMRTSSLWSLPAISGGVFVGSHIANHCTILNPAAPAWGNSCDVRQRARAFHRRHRER
jgi:hypothetical protein